MIMSSNVCKLCQRKTTVMKRCTSCRSVIYCSQQCQIKDWPTHKILCNQSAVDEINISGNYSTGSAKSSHEILNASQINKTDLGTEFKNSGHKLRYISRIDFAGAAGQLKQEESESTSKKFGNDINKENESKSKKGVTNKPVNTDSYIYCDKKKFDLPEEAFDEPTVSITVKANKEKNKLNIGQEWSGSEVMKFISCKLSVPLDSLKLIHKGKFVNRDNVVSFLKPKAVFQAIGEKAENEEGVNPADIEVIRSQLSVSRNEAVKALKDHKDVIDAILHLSNK